MKVEDSALSLYPGRLPASMCVCVCVCVCTHIQSFVHSLTHLSVLIDSTSSKLELGLSAGGEKGNYDDG